MEEQRRRRMRKEAMLRNGLILIAAGLMLLSWVFDLW
jgi:hypothetical protein